MTNQELIALVKKNPVSVSCGVLALALGAGLYFRSGGLPAAAATLEQVSTEGQRLSTNIKNATQLTEQIAALEEAGGKVAPRIVSAAELAKNLQYFYKLEAETGTKLLDSRQLPPGGATAKRTYVGIGYALTVQGDYAALLDFLRRLENGGHYCRVMTAVMTAAGGDVDRSGPLKISLSLELLGQP